MPRSVFSTWHPQHVERHARRRRAFDRGRPILERLWLRRGWSWSERKPGQLSIDVGVAGPTGSYAVVWHPSKGIVRIPGELGCFRAHDPVQAQVLLDYAAAKLRWLYDHGQLPHQARRSWGDLEPGPFAPPWPATRD